MRVIPIGEVVRDILTKFVLRAHLRELEERIEIERFDKELSGRIDAVKFLLKE